MPFVPMLFGVVGPNLDRNGQKRSETAVNGQTAVKGAVLRQHNGWTAMKGIV